MPAGGEDIWSLEGVSLAGGWDETSRRTGVVYRWPDGSVDRYAEFVSYRGREGYAGMDLALGYLPLGDVAGFVLGPGPNSRRGLTWFFPTDDFGDTQETISMIRGGGPRGRSGFAPSELLPKAYADFEVGVLRDRKAGKWRVQGVVARRDDHETMLAHTALQARLRGLA